VKSASPAIDVGAIVCRPRCVASGLPPTARLIASSVLPPSSGVIESMRFMACLLSPRRNDASAFLPGVYQTRTSTRRQIEGKASCDVTDRQAAGLFRVEAAELDAAVERAVGVGVIGRLGARVAEAAHGQPLVVDAVCDQPIGDGLGARLR